MFDFFKKKLKETIQKVSKKAEEEAEDVVVEKPVETKPAEDIKKEGFFSKIFKRKEEIKEEIEAEETPKEEKPTVEEIRPKPEVKEEKAAEEPEIKEKAKKEIKEKIKAERKEERHEDVSKLTRERIYRAEPVLKPKIAEKKKTEEIVKEVYGAKKTDGGRAELVEEKKVEEERAEEISGGPEEEKEFTETEKKGFFAKVAEKFTTKKISEDKFNELFWDLELVMLENNVAVEVVEKVKNDLKEKLVDKPIPRNKIEDGISGGLRDSINGVLSVDGLDFIGRIKQKKPFVVCFVGINGGGKTTTIAKMVNLLKKKGLTSVIAASDTFRAAAIQQLEEHAARLGVKVIKHDYGADAAAVAFDAVKYAQANDIDAVLIDTAGRLHSNVNLVDEMKKIIRVAKPDLKIFVGESITGNDCVEQAKKFDEAIGLDGVVLSKADVDDKGGAAISIGYVVRKPIIYLGVGQNYDDLVEFDKGKILASLGL